MNKIILEESDLKKNIKLEDNNSYYIYKCDKKVRFSVSKNSNVVVNFFNTNSVNSNYEFDIMSGAVIEVNIFDAAENITRYIKVNMNEENSSIKFNLGSISLNENNYDINVFHNNKNTNSETTIHGLALDNNKIFIKNNGYITKGSSKSNLNQDNKIIIMRDNNCKIEPNLFIDEYDVSASHGAYIGKFDEDELFYLNSRGLDDNESYNLLINGFLIGNMNITNEDKEYLKEIINKYWR